MKSGNSRSESLRTLIDSAHCPDISWGVKFARANVGFANGVLTLPYSTVFLLRCVLDGLKGCR